MLDRHRGFTIVELLVVIAIIGLLMALLFPAVQAARSAARRSVCAQHRRQVALAILHYESLSQGLPAFQDVRLRSRETVWNAWRSTGWRLAILPFIEEQPLHDQLTAHGVTLRVPEERTDHRPAIVEAFMCPLDPEWPPIGHNQVQDRRGDILFDAFSRINSMPVVAVRLYPTRPRELAGAQKQSFVAHAAWAPSTRPLGSELHNNFQLSYPLREVTPFWQAQPRLRWIRDGTSQTVLTAEAFGSLWPMESGMSVTTVYDDDPIEVKFTPRPESDRVHFNPPLRSNHAGGGHIAMCDGAVRFITPATSARAYARLLTRASGELHLAPSAASR